MRREISIEDEANVCEGGGVEEVIAASATAARTQLTEWILRMCCGKSFQSFQSSTERGRSP